MPKQIESALKVFVVTFLVVTGIGLLAGGTTLGAILGGAEIALFGASAMSIAAMSAAGTLVSGLMNKGVDAISQENFGTKVATRTATAPRNIIYGKARIGGVMTHIETSGTDNHKLRLIVTLAGHEIEDVESIYFGENKLTTASSGGFQYVTNSKYRNSDNDNAFSYQNSLARFIIKKGDQTTADSTITSNSSLNTNDKFTKVAYVFLELIFDSEAFGGGIPQLFFVVKGKKVFDPRDSNQTFGNESTYEWSDNPALCVLDYVTNTDYGLKATADEVLTDTTLGSFKTSANTCDLSSTVTTATVNGNFSSVSVIQISLAGIIDVGHIVTGTGVPSGTTVVSRRGTTLTVSQNVSVSNGATLSFGERAYSANGITNMSATGEAVLSGLLSSCAGKLSFINGKFVMFAGANVTPQMTITDDHLISAPDINTNVAGDDTYNSVKAVYVDSNNNYVASESSVYTDSTLLSSDTPSGESSANYRKTMELNLPFTTTNAMAQRIQKAILTHHRKSIGISLSTNIGFMQLQPFDWVYVTNERLGFTNKVFEVMSTSLTETQSNEDNATVLCTQLQLKEIDNSVYTFAQADYIDPIDNDDPPETGDYTVTAPTSLGLTQRSEIDGPVVKADIEVAWTNNQDDLVAGTEVAYKLSSDSDFEGDYVVGKGVTKGLIPNVVVGKTYNVKVRHFSANNVYSDYTNAVNITISDATSISAPSAFTATGHRVGIVLQWTNPSNSNLRAIKIYRKTSNSTPTNDTNLVHTMTGEPSSKSVMFQGAMDGLTAGTTYFFWLRAITHSGTHSAFTSSVNASYSIYDKGDIGLNNVTNDAQIKDDGSNAPNILKNDQISISKVNGAVRLGNTGSNTDITLDNADIGLPNVTNHAQIKDDGSNAPNILKNAQITIASDGTLNNAGGGQATAVGLGAVKTDLTNAPNTIKNDQVTLAKDGSGNLSLNNAGSGNVSFDKNDVGLGNLANSRQVDLDLGNAPDAIKNAQVTLAKDSSGNLSLNNAGSGNVSFDNSDVGLGNVTNDAQIKTDGSNAPNALKNNQISLTSSGGTVTLNNANTTNKTFTKADVALGNVTNDAQIKSDGSNAPNILKNDQVTLAKDGSGNLSLNNAGSGNVSFDNSDVGLGNVTNDAQIKTDGSNAPNALKNNQITISSAGVLSNAGGGTVSATGLGAVKTDLTNAPASIKNENTTATDVGLGNVTNDAQVKSDGSNAPNILKNDQITIGLSGTTLSLNNAGSGNQTLGKANVGLTDLASLDSTRSGKLDGVATGSTNNGSTIDTNGNITGNMSVGATMTLGTNSDDKIVVGNITIDGGNGRILITD